MKSTVLFSLLEITEKLGIPTKVLNSAAAEVKQELLNSIQLYNINREIYGTFFYKKNAAASQYDQIIFGPLLMAEVKFGLSEAKSATQEFREILNNLFVLMNHVLPEHINEEQLNLEYYYQTSKFTYNTFEDMDEFYRLELLLFSHIKDRNKLAASKTLELFIKHYYKHLTTNQLKCFYCALITLLTRVEIEKGNPVNKVFNQQLLYYHFSQEIQDIHTFEGLIKRAFQDFFSQSTKIPKNTYSPTTICVLNYVENHLHEATTLAEICHSLGREAKYVGKLFYKEIGMHFKDYVHLKKVEKAKYLLLFSNKTINEISEELSFCSQSHFSSIFKRIVGTTPYKYKSKRVYYSY
ncbi:helix-turn-helix domain-containing protein [Erwinia sp. CPCC 100877]|nr:helix-turn-helix domain-containing protein [Erwinia sp. CPCC 100877]